MENNKCFNNTEDLEGGKSFSYGDGRNDVMDDDSNVNDDFTFTVMG